MGLGWLEKAVGKINFCYMSRLQYLFISNGAKTNWEATEKSTYLVIWDDAVKGLMHHAIHRNGRKIY